MLSLKTNMQNTVDFSKIRKVAESATAEIYIGFPSGRKHVETKHKNENGEYKDINGKDPQYANLETADLARMLHFGAAGIPARPFLEDGVLSKKKEIKGAMAKEVKKVVEGGTPNWDKVGTMAVGAVQELVRSDYYKSRVPNSPKTVKYKGSDQPLIDGADLINSLSYVVESNDKIGTMKGTMDSDTYQQTDFRSSK